MAQLLNAFNANEVDPSQGGGGNMPVGKHPVVVVGSEIVPTRANDGAMLVLTLQIIDGPSKGAEGPMRLNLYLDSKPEAKRIAHQQLSALCHAIGVFQVNNSEQLHGKPFMVDVQLQRDAEAAKNGYTEVRKILDINGNEPGKAHAGQQHAQGAATQQQASAAGQQSAGWGANSGSGGAAVKPKWAGG